MIPAFTLRRLLFLSALLALLGSAPTAAHAQDFAAASAPPKGATSSDTVLPTPKAKQRIRASGVLSAAALIPQEGYARETAGMGIEGGVWLEMDHAVFEPRAGVRFDVKNEKRDYWQLVPLDVGMYWLGNFEDNALYFGPGFSFLYVQEMVDLKETVGSELMATSERTSLEFQYCGGVFARAGLIFSRTSAIRTVMSIDYALTFVDFEKTSLMRAVRLNLGLQFGKGRG